MHDIVYRMRNGQRVLGVTGVNDVSKLPKNILDFVDITRDTLDEMEDNDDEGYREDLAFLGMPSSSREKLTRVDESTEDGSNL